MSHPASAKRRLALVIESHAGVRRLVGRMLEHLGIEALFAADNDQAIARWTACGHRVDLLIAEVGGVAAPRTLVISAMLTRRPGLPIILLAGNPSGQHVDYVAPLRAALLGKPFTPAQLAESIERALAASSARKIA
jgi:CheY-like chemotaxis protein